MTNNIVEKEPIHLVPTFHYDVVYLKDYQGCLDMSIAILDRALDILSEDQDYTFTMEQILLLEEYWKLRPQKHDLLKRFVSEGRFKFAPGMYVMPDMNMIDGESMFMQAKVGKDWLRKHLDVSTDSCWIADCWGHHAQLPQILSQAGYKYYFFWRCMRRDVRKNEFLWQGLDGTNIKTHWLATGYANLHFPNDKGVENVLELDLAGVSPEAVNKLYNSIAEYDTAGAVMICNGGDFCTPQASAPEIVKSLNASGEVPEIKFSNPTAYMESINWNAVPTFDGEFNSAFQGTFTSNIKIKQLNQKACNKLTALEKLSVLMNRPMDLLEVWKLVLKQQFHDAICGTVADPPLAEIYRDFEEIEKMLEYGVKELEDEGGCDGVFNPLSFEREAVFCSKDLEFRGLIPPLQTKNISAFETVNCTPQAVALPCSFKNDYYNAEIGRDGFISSLVESASGEQIIAEHESPFGAISMQMDYGDLWLNFEGPLNGGCKDAALTRNVPDPFNRESHNSLVFSRTIHSSVTEVKAVKSGSRLIIKQYGKLNYWMISVDFETEIVFSQGSPVVEYKTKIKPGGKNYRIRAAFPTTVKNGAITHEIPMGMQARGEHEHASMSWIDNRNDKVGASLFKRGIPSSNVDDGVMMLTLFRSAAMEYKCVSKNSFNEGIEHCFEYAFMPHSAVAYEEVVKRAHAFSNPVIPVKCGNVVNNFELDGSDSIHISSIRWSDGDIFVRLYEACGKDGEVTVKLPDNAVAYAFANGLQQPVNDFVPAAMAITLDFKPFEIKNLLIKISVIPGMAQGSQREPASLGTEGEQ